ncbi:MAG: type II CRISPR-associated endonuclease Cas1 [Bacilli bacterium]
MSWKTVYINQDTKVSLELNAMKITTSDGEYIKVNICDINTVIFAHEKMTITIPLISRLVKDNVNILITDEKKDPIGIFLPFNNHSIAFKRLEIQMNWKKTTKNKLWKEIIYEKINGEIHTLKKVGQPKEITDKLKTIQNDLCSADKTNREGVAAKFYFKYMFDNKFVRFSDDATNYALNYGYKILASHISRVIASRGYITQLGIHHRGESNAYNLTYDFIEPFRCIIDLWVYHNIDDEFRMKHRHQLMDALNWKVCVNNKQVYLSYAIELIIDSYFKNLNLNSPIAKLDYSSVNYGSS